MREFKVDWDNVSATIAVWEETVFSTSPLWIPKDILVGLQMLYATVAVGDDAIPAARVRSMLPSASDMATAGVVHIPEIGMGPMHTNHVRCVTWPM